MPVKFEDLKTQVKPETWELLQKADDESKKVLENLFMMQSDYSRNLDVHRSEKEALERAVKDYEAKAQKWNDFYQGDQPVEWRRRYESYPTMERELADAKAEIAQKVAELEAAKAAANGEAPDVNSIAQAIEARLASKFVTADVAKKMAEDAAKLAEGRVLDRGLGTYDQILSASQRAERELGEPLDRRLIAEELTRTGNIEVAYDNLTRAKRDAKRQAEVDAQIKEAEERGKQLGINETLARQKHPEDTTGLQGHLGMGALEASMKHAGKELPPDYEPGAAGALGHIAAEEYRKMESEGFKSPQP